MNPVNTIPFLRAAGRKWKKGAYYPLGLDGWLGDSRNGGE